VQCIFEATMLSARMYSGERGRYRPSAGQLAVLDRRATARASPNPSYEKPGEINNLVEIPRIGGSTPEPHANAGKLRAVPPCRIPHSAFSFYFPTLLHISVVFLRNLAPHPTGYFPVTNNRASKFSRSS